MPAGGQLADHVEHLGDEFGVEGARHLVEEEQPGLHRERAHDRDALLLPTGEAVGIVEPLVDEPEALEEPVGLGVRLRPSEAARLPRSERHVLEHRHVREEVERLEHDPDPAADTVHVDTRGRDLLPADGDASGIDRLEEIDAAEQGRLARP